MTIHIRNSTLLFAFLLSGAFSFSQGTRTWEQSKFEDMVKGTTDGVAILSNGTLELAPTFKELATTPSPYVWSIASDRNGNLFAATGTPARVYRMTPDGKASAIFQSQELQVQALAVADDGTLYAATNPDGKVYRIEASGSANSHQKKKKNNDASVADVPVADASWSSSVFFDPGSKYIWNLALDRDGNLYVATGDHGEIFRVTSKADHSVFFKSDEAHIRALAFDLQGNLIAGSDGSGLIYRISPDGEGFVLYSAPKKEITAIAVDASGNIYAAGVGEKKSGPPNLPNLSVPSSSSSSTSPQLNIKSAMSLSMSAAASAATSPLGNFGNFAGSPAGGSEIYRINAGGVPTRIWLSNNDLVYTLAFDLYGKLLAGTGNRGHIFQINRPTGNGDQYIDLLTASASQITAFAPAPNHGLYASSSNLGKIFLMGASPNTNGIYVSDVFDARIFSRWGRAEFRGSGNVELFARSGNVDNPDRNWSPWKKVEWQKDAEVSVPPARFIQWKTVLHAGSPEPRVESVTLNYLSKNVAPEFDSVIIEDGVRYQTESGSAGSGGKNTPGASQHNDSPPSSTPDRGSIGVKWNVHDDNGDDMVYAISYREENESRWLPLKEGLTDKFYSFDSSLLPDGAYTVKIVASDAPSHSPKQGLTAERESARFEIDTMPPQVLDLKAALDGKQLHVTFRASDSFSPIEKAEYSVDAGDWQLVEPIGQISDSKTENYDFRADVAQTYGSGTSNQSLEHVIVVRAYDRHENMGTSKIVIEK